MISIVRMGHLILNASLSELATVMCWYVILLYGFSLERGRAYVAEI